MSAVVGIADDQGIPDEKPAPPSYYEALLYPLDADDKYSPIHFVDALRDQKNDICSRLNKEDFTAQSPTAILLRQESISNHPSEVSNQTHNELSKISEGHHDTTKNYNKSYTDSEDCKTPLKNQTTKRLSFKECSLKSDVCSNGDSSRNHPCDPDVVPEKYEKSNTVDHTKHAYEPDVVSASIADLQTGEHFKESSESIHGSSDKCLEPVKDDYTEILKDSPEVQLRNHSSLRGYSGCRPISGITTRSFSPEPGPSGYVGAKNKGPRKVTVKYDSQNGSVRTLPTSSSENVNSIHELSYRIDPEMDKQALRTGEAADRGTLYCACGILCCIIGIVLILVYMV